MKKFINYPDYAIDPFSWGANTEVYPWARNPYEDSGYRWYIQGQNISLAYSLRDGQDSIVSATDIFNECGALAKWMVDKGWRIDIAPTLTEPDGKFSEIQKGDIIFFAEQMGISGAFKMYVADMFPGYNYRNITHAAIVTDVVTVPNSASDKSISYNGYEYFIQVIDVPSILENYLKQNSSHFEYRTQMEDILPEKYKYTSGNNLSYYMRSLSTIALVCRPDLSSTSEDSYLETEARNLKLHTIPETKEQVEIVKKCRACTDVEWIPAIDYDRPMPLTSLNSTVERIATQRSVTMNYYQPMVDGLFKAGVKYKGIPWTAKPVEMDGYVINLNPEAFLSLIEHEDATGYIDPDTQKKYPLYGWNDPVELLQFVFGIESVTVNYQIVEDHQFSFISRIFKGDLEPGMEDTPFYVPVYNQLYLDYIKLGDVIVSTTNGFYNCGIITDFVRNDLGQVTQIEVTEATKFGLENPKAKNGSYGNLIRRKWFSPTELAEWYMIEVDGHLYPEVDSGGGK